MKKACVRGAWHRGRHCVRMARENVGAHVGIMCVVTVSCDDNDHLPQQAPQPANVPETPREVWVHELAGGEHIHIIVGAVSFD